MQRKLMVLAALLGAAVPTHAAMAATPDLVGSWVGKAERIDAKGKYSEADIVVTIVDQKDRRFHGTITHEGTTDKIVGMIRSDIKTFYWVNVDNQGLVQGSMLGADGFEACRLESGENAQVSCAKMTRKQ